MENADFRGRVLRVDGKPVAEFSRVFNSAVLRELTARANAASAIIHMASAILDWSEMGPEEYKAKYGVWVAEGELAEPRKIAKAILIQAGLARLHNR